MLKIKFKGFEIGAVAWEEHPYILYYEELNKGLVGVCSLETKSFNPGHFPLLRDVWKRMKQNGSILIKYITRGHLWLWNHLLKNQKTNTENLD